MHFEFLVEEPSMEFALNNLLPKILDLNVNTYSIRTFQGKYDLLSKLPERLRGYKRNITDNDRIAVLIDRDNDDCFELKRKLEQRAINARLTTKSSVGSAEIFVVLNRIVIEELESWFLGDVYAIKYAFPDISNNYVTTHKNILPDEISKPSKKLETLLQRNNYYITGLPKIEVAEKISKHMVPQRNKSKSFQIFCSGLRACSQQVQHT
jgi:hypothetical protein